MKKRARSVLTGLLMGCWAVVAVTLPTGDKAKASAPVSSVGESAVQAGVLQPVWSWIQEAARAVGTFVASACTSVHDFFASGEALRLIQSATHGVNGFGTRLLLPVSSLVAPIVTRLLPGAGATPELVALWLFWILIILILVVLIAVLRPRHATRRLPKVTPRTPGQEENTIQFGMVEQGPQPSPGATPAQAARTHEPEVGPVSHEQPAVLQPAEQVGPSPARTESPSIPEISLEPLGLFGEHPAPQAAPLELEKEPETSPPAPAVLPLLESIESPTLAASGAAEPSTAPEAPEAEHEIPAEPQAEAPATAESEIPTEALLSMPEGAAPVPAPPVEEPVQPIPEPSLTPLGEQPPIESQPPAEDTAAPMFEPLIPEQAPIHQTEPQPLDATQTATPEVAAGSPDLSGEQAVPTSQAPADEGMSASSEISEAVVAPPVESTPDVPPAPAESTPDVPPAPAAADLLTRLLDEEESFPRTIASAAQPMPPTQPAPTLPTPEPSVFDGDVDLDELLRDGVVTDAQALEQLFRGGYRNRISKLAISAKDLQNVSEDMRQVIKLTVVALSPIELSIARDLAMRLEGPGFVGEALLVAKKMGYEHYLTTYRNISKNYKDVSIVETTSLKVPTLSSQSNDDLISFN